MVGMTSVSARDASASARHAAMHPAMASVGVGDGAYVRQYTYTAVGEAVCDGAFNRVGGGGVGGGVRAFGALRIHTSGSRSACTENPPSPASTSASSAWPRCVSDGHVASGQASGAGSCPPSGPSSVHSTMWRSALGRCVGSTNCVCFAARSPAARARPHVSASIGPRAAADGHCTMPRAVVAVASCADVT